jgi:transcriptional regulator with XRE-family HTH domain
MARAAIKISMCELAKLSGTSTNSLVNMEKGRRVSHYLTNPVRAALEASGIEFLDNNGVQLRQG